MEVDPDLPISRLWDRLSTLVVYHSKDDPGRDFDDIDDVIIYRCLMMILLLRTAADSSKILESGLWDKVVPII